MSNEKNTWRRENDDLKRAQAEGGFTRIRIYTRLAGPGWLQSALMLGGGSLAGSLYLGVLTGVNALWLQPLAMILTIIIFGALSYVVLSTGEAPFKAINTYVNPVLGWSWALAALATCMVWAMPQYALAVGVIQQNLAPGLLGGDGVLGDRWSRIVITAMMFTLVTSIAWHYSQSGTGVKIFEWILKGMIYLVVACFIGVVIRMSLLPGGLDWGAIFRGIIPDPRLFFQPADGYAPLLAAVPDEFRSYWESVIVGRQREVMIAVTAAAGGVNATFLLAYSMLRRGWGKEHRGLAIFDLGTGMLIPFALATSCVIIAASTQFHTVPQPGFDAREQVVSSEIEPSAAHRREFHDLLTKRVLYEQSRAGLPALTIPEMQSRLERLADSERTIAATLLTRDAFDLAASLEPLTGSLFARIIFGLGVLGMTMSSVIIHMLVSGMVVCEMLGRPHTGWTLRLGSLAAGTGVLGPFLWQYAAFWLAIPTSIFAFILLPAAYFTFYVMLNNRRLMGSERMGGYRGLAVNGAMLSIIVLFAFISLHVIWNNAGWWGLALVAVFLLAIFAGHYKVRRSSDRS